MKTFSEIVFMPGATAYQKAVCHDETMDQMERSIEAKWRDSGSWIGRELFDLKFLEMFEQKVQDIIDGQREVPLHPTA